MLIKVIAEDIGERGSPSDAKRIAHDLRCRLAVVLAQGQYYMVSDFNYHNGSATRNYAVISAKTRDKVARAKEHNVSPSRLRQRGHGTERTGMG